MTSHQIMIVGEAWGRYEAEKGRPFVGPSGKLLNAFLAAHGIERHTCYLTNVFNFQPSYNKIESLCGPKAGGIPDMPDVRRGKYIRAEFAPELKRLFGEIETVNPNLIFALGGVACWALLRTSAIRKVRGYPIKAAASDHKVLATYHPAAVLREMKLRPLVFADTAKAAREQHFPEIRRPVREFWVEPTIQDLYDFDPHIIEAEYLSVDIESWNRQITMIGFAPSPERAIVVPFAAHKRSDCNYWKTTEEERQAWNFVKRWLGLGKKIVGQNFLYDANYLWRFAGIPTYTIHSDTMLMHHAMQPEMEKSLAVLGSLYTDEPGWKFLRKGLATLKKED